VVAVPTTDCTADTVAKEFVERIVLTFGAPSEVLSDNGPAFASEVVDRVCAMAGTKKIFTTAYRPQANGLVERWNGTIAQSLRAFMDEDFKSWDDKVPFITFAYNTAVNAATKMTPFELVQGRSARLPIDIVLGTRPSEQRAPSEYYNELLIRMQEGFRAARDADDQAKRTRERRGALASGKTAVFQQGDKVLLDNKLPVSKFDKKFEGPYVVADVHDKNYVTLVKEDGEKVKVHAERLKPFKERASPVPRPISQSLTISADEVEVEVEPDPNMLPNDLLGKRVRVWWSGERQWFDGTITARKKKLHVVKYDDGEIKAERLMGFNKKVAPAWKLLVRRRSDDSPL
jgi:ribosomal protein L21E